MLRDRLVCNDRAIQQQLLAQPGLTYQKAVELALSAETAAQSMRELGVKTESGPSARLPQEVHKTSTSGTSPAGHSSPHLLPLWSQGAHFLQLQGRQKH
jgi:hypothetical protein